MKDLAAPLARGTLDAVPLSAAVLDGDGDILATNEAWRRFGRENDIDGPPDCTGRNYVAASAAADDEYARQATDGIEAVLAGDRDAFEFEYPCHSPDEARWFLMHARRFTVDAVPYVVVVHQNVTARKLAEEAVVRKNENLETLASLLSHDLRNPLTVAMGRADLIAAERDSEHVAPLRAALDRMNGMLERALAVLRGSGELDRTRVSLHALAEDAWTYVEEPDATLVLRDDTELRADPALLQNVFENLFRNAIEHGSSRPGADARGGVTVTVGALRDGFYVEDDGPGIPPEDRGRVFDLGFTTGTDGSGFGLGIARFVVENHGWTICVTESEAGGARFEVRTAATPEHEPQSRCQAPG